MTTVRLPFASLADVVRRLPMRVKLSNVAAVGAHAPPMSKGSRIRQNPSLDRERDLSRGDLNAWTAEAPWACAKI
jgi:hypothetical protein